MQTHLEPTPLKWNDMPYNASAELPAPVSEVSSEELVRRLRERQREAAQQYTCLTTRERQVLQMVTEGLPNKTVARALQISIKTVEKHRSSVMRKLRLRSVCDLLRFWFALTWDDSLQSERSQQFSVPASAARTYPSFS